MRTFKGLSLPLLDDTMESIRPLATVLPPTGGWVRSIREAIGMTRDQLARRVKVSSRTIETLERSEAQGKITLESLNRLARGLDCQVVYALVPNSGKTLDRMVHDQAECIARKQLGRVAHSMRLEEQGLNEKQERRQLDRLIQTLLAGSRRRLWR